MSSGTDTYASDASAVPLLTALLERAETALGASTSAAVPIDSELIRAALAESSDGRTTPEVRARVCELFASRTRRHLRRVVAAVGGDVRGDIKRLFQGPLQRALLLLIEPAEEHFARKMHAAFYGLKRTPELDENTLQRHPTKRGSFLERAQSQSGIMTHDDTLVTVVASRVGRDLSGIKHAYEQLYNRKLVDVLSHETHGDLKALLVAVVDMCGQYTEREYS